MLLKDLVRFKIREARLKRRLTQKEAARLIDVSQQTWANYESGRIGVRTDDLDGIAQALGEPVSFFITDTSGDTTLAEQVEYLLRHLSQSEQEEIRDIARLKLDRDYVSLRSIQLDRLPRFTPAPNRQVPRKAGAKSRRSRQKKSRRP